MMIERIVLFEYTFFSLRKFAVFCLSIILAAASAFALRFAIYPFNMAEQNPFYLLLLLWLLFALSFFMYFHVYNKNTYKPNLSILLLAFFFAMTTLIRVGFDEWDSLHVVWGTKQYAVHAVYFGATLIFFFSALLRVLLSAITSISSRSPVWRWEWHLFGHSLWRPAATIFVCWLPYLIAFYPGSLEWDMLTQIMVYDGLLMKSNAHPMLSTFIIGQCIALGRIYGSENLGAFLYILLQSVVLASAFGYMTVSMFRWRTPKWVVWGTLCYFAFLPLWGFVAQFGVKDVLYTGVFVVFVTMLWNAMRPETIDRRPLGRLVGPCATGILLCFLRNNGIVSVLPSFIVLAFSMRKKHGSRPWFILAGLTVSIYLLFIGVFLPAIGTSGTSIKEVLSIPFQQTGRYVRDFGDTVTDEERQAIDKVLEYDKIRNMYYSYWADGVKERFRAESTTEDLFGYFSVWMQMGRKQPLTYIEAFLSGSYVYYCPGAALRQLPLCLFNTEVVYDHFYYGVYVPSPYTQSEALQPARNMLMRYYEAIDNMPIVGLLVDQGFYTWLLCFLYLIIWYFRRDGIRPSLMPSLTVALQCVLSPVNGMLRYSLPLIAVSPILLAGVLQYAIGWGDESLPFLKYSYTPFKKDCGSY